MNTNIDTNTKIGTTEIRHLICCTRETITTDRNNPEADKERGFRIDWELCTECGKQFKHKIHRIKTTG